MRRAAISTALLLLLATVWLSAANEPPRPNEPSQPVKPAGTANQADQHAAAPNETSASKPGNTDDSPTPRELGRSVLRTSLADLAGDDDGAKVEDRLRRKLLTPLKAEFADVPLREAIESVAKAGGVQSLRIDRQALKEEEVGLDEPITLSLGETTAANALQWILEPRRLAFDVRRGILNVTTAVKSDERMRIRSWDVRTLVDVMVSREWPESESQFRASAQGRGFFQFGNAGVNPVNFPGMSIEHDASPRARAMARLADLVQIVASGGLWNEHEGAPLGYVGFLDTTLVVRTTESYLERIEALLLALEAVAAKPGRSAIEVASWREPVAANQAVRRRMRDTVADWDSVDLPLSEFAKLVREKTGCPVVLDVEALKEEGFAVDAPVSFSGRGVATAIALDTALDAVGLGFEVRGGAVHISTEVQLDESFVVVVHDLGGIAESESVMEELARTFDETIHPTTRQLFGNPERARIVPWNGALVTLGTVANQADTARILDGVRKHKTGQPDDARGNPKAENERLFLRVYAPHQRGIALALKTLIEDRIARETWETRKGPGSIDVVGDLLLVRQTRAVHRVVARLLETLLNADRSLPPPQKPDSPK